MFRDNEVILLLGAGCSADADIPVSKRMVEKLEQLLKSDGGWKPYSEFYYLVKSAILYSDGIQNLPSGNFDIERLVNVLGELEKRENNVIYPFVGSWIPRLLEVATYEFQQKCKEFRTKILQELQQWVTLSDDKKGAYYSKLFDFQSEYNYPLRVFSLNYDLGIEKNIPDTKQLQRGFDPKTRTWSWKPFELQVEFEPNIYLYKLHGSIDWERESDRTTLKEVDSTPKVPDLIFGTDYKMQYIDPYLFYAYEFRKYSLEAKIIITIGYSFRDQHVNGILHQAIRTDRDKKILIVSPNADEIKSQLETPHEQYKEIKKGAKSFLEGFTVKELGNLIK